MLDASDWGLFRRTCVSQDSDSSTCKIFQYECAGKIVSYQKPVTGVGTNLYYGDFARKLSPSEEVLALYITKNKGRFKSRRVLDVGAGLGFAGFTCAVCTDADRVDLTDGDPEVVRTLRASSKLNESNFGSTKVKVKKIRWDKSAEWPRTCSYDLVIAADIVAQGNHCSLINLLAWVLRPGGLFLLFASRRTFTLDDFLLKARHRFPNVVATDDYDEEVANAIGRSSKCFPVFVTFNASEVAHASNHFERRRPSLERAGSLHSKPVLTEASHTLPRKPRKYQSCPELGTASAEKEVAGYEMGSTASRDEAIETLGNIISQSAVAMGGSCIHQSLQRKAIENVPPPCDSGDEELEEEEDGLKFPDDVNMDGAPGEYGVVDVDGITSQELTVDSGSSEALYLGHSVRDPRDDYYIKHQLIHDIVTVSRSAPALPQEEAWDKNRYHAPHVDDYSDRGLEEDTTEPCNIEDKLIDVSTREGVVMTDVPLQHQQATKLADQEIIHDDLDCCAPEQDVELFEGAVIKDDPGSHNDEMAVLLVQQANQTGTVDPDQLLNECAGILGNDCRTNLNLSHVRGGHRTAEVAIHKVSPSNKKQDDSIHKKVLPGRACDDRSVDTMWCLVPGQGSADRMLTIDDRNSGEHTGTSDSFHQNTPACADTDQSLLKPTVPPIIGLPQIAPPNLRLPSSSRSNSLPWSSSSSNSSISPRCSPKAYAIAQLAPTLPNLHAAPYSQSKLGRSSLLASSASQTSLAFAHRHLPSPNLDRYHNPSTTLGKPRQSLPAKPERRDYSTKTADSRDSRHKIMEAHCEHGSRAKDELFPPVVSLRSSAVEAFVLENLYSNGVEIPKICNDTTRDAVQQEPRIVCAQNACAFSRSLGPRPAGASTQSRERYPCTDIGMDRLGRSCSGSVSYSSLEMAAVDGTRSLSKTKSHGSLSRLHWISEQSDDINKSVLHPARHAQLHVAMREIVGPLRKELFGGRRATCFTHSDARRPR